MKRKRLVAALAVALPIVLVHFPFVFGTKAVMAPDFDAYYRPHFAMAAESWHASGAFPRWNPYQYAGTPYLGNVEANVHYPPNLVYLFLPSAKAFHALFLFHMLLAAGGGYRLARFLGLGRTAAVLSGLAYGLSLLGIARMHDGCLTYYVTPAHAPLLLLFLLRALRRPGVFAAVVLGLESAVLVAGSIPQHVCHAVFLCAATALWALSRRGSPWRAGVLTVAAAALLGVGAVAIHLIPALDLLPWTTRGAGQVAASYVEGVPAKDSIEPAHLLSLGIPWLAMNHVLPEWKRIHDPWHEKALYLGILPLMLAAVALAARWRNRTVLLFLVVGGVALLDAMASLLPVHSLLAQLPFYGLFRLPCRNSWLIVLSLAMLCGFGWEAVAERAALVRRVAPAMFAACLVVAAVAWIGYGHRGGAAILMALSAAGGAVLWAGPRYAWAGILLVAADLAYFQSSYLHSRSSDRGVSEPWYARHIGKERADYRILDCATAGPRYGGFGFRALNGFGYPYLQPMVDFYGKAWKDYPGAWILLGQGTEIADPEVLRMLNLRWIVSGIPLSFPGWREVAREGGRFLYEDDGARPMAFFPEAPGGFHVTRPDFDTIVARVDSDGPRRLVVSESWLPGWRAEVGGRAAPVHREHGALLGVDVPAGASEVRLVYDPLSARAGRVVTLLSLVAAGLALLAAEVRRAW